MGVDGTADLSVRQAGEALRAGELTSVSLTQDTLTRVFELDPEFKAFILVTSERALEDAAEADKAFAEGIDRGPLQGIPYALKDIIDTANIPTTCNSRLRLGHVPTADGPVAARLAAGGGVLVGKLNTFEFAVAGPDPELPFPPAKNPWDMTRFTGGSSSGAGVAVAAGMLRVALGTDTGGSVQFPAAMCGTVGLKPTFGRVPCRGIFPISSTLDHCGPLARTVEDAALALQVIAGRSSRPDIRRHSGPRLPQRNRSKRRGLEDRLCARTSRRFLRCKLRNLQRTRRGGQDAPKLRGDGR